MTGEPSALNEKMHKALRLDRPLPRVAMIVGPSVRGWVVRLAQFVVALVGAILVVTGSFQWSVAVVALVFLVVRPTPTLSAACAGGLGLALLLQPVDPGSPRPYVMLFLIHLLVVLGTVIGRLAPTALYEWRALSSRGVTFLIVQAVSQGTALAVAGLSNGRPAMVGVAVTAAVVLAAIAWVAFALTNAAAARAQRRRL